MAGSVRGPKQYFRVALAVTAPIALSPQAGGSALRPRPGPFTRMECGRARRIRLRLERGPGRRSPNAPAAGAASSRLPQERAAAAGRGGGGPRGRARDAGLRGGRGRGAAGGGPREEKNMAPAAGGAGRRRAGRQ